MFSFRQKIFIGYAIAFLTFLLFLYPFATHTVRRIAINALEDRASSLIEKIKDAPDNESLVDRIKDLKATAFFRVSVITDQRKVLYDSHTKRLLGDDFSQEYVVDHPEVLEAFQKGVGYSEDYSKILAQRFTYMAKVFDFHGRPYILRIAFPYEYVSQLTHDLGLGFLLFTALILLLFSLLTWFIIHYLTRPIQEIIDAVKRYQKGDTQLIPKIKLSSISPNDDFSQLSHTLNSLSQMIQGHINSLTEERNEKETVLESLSEGVIAVNNQMSVTYVNGMARKLLGIQEDLLGENFSKAGLPICQNILEACLKERQVVASTMQIKTDKKSYLDLIASSLKDNGGAILVIQDKTAHHKMLEMRKDFIANASHELKTPITIIHGFAETLHDNPQLPPETTQEVTEKIVRNCQRMENIIKDLLILTDVENIPQFRLKECDLEQILIKCKATVQTIHPTARINLDKTEHENFTMQGDPHLLELAFNNLIENAAKYSEAPASINISLRKDPQKITLAIEDKGIGIPEADLDHIFERFYTVDKAHSRKMGGSGLGLSIVETIISKHRGKIHVSSKVGEGTTFTILFPLNLSL